ncbi:hypothetical protein [Nonomuraea glycinis]|uniref:hypothetical protein n=1 Tax=Nonomuraea glycinis TaxID=2047744 RepID=UPI00339E7BC2
MMLIQVAFVVFASLLAVFAIIGAFGLVNLLLLPAGLSWRQHLAVWAGSVTLLAVLGFAMPPYITEHPDGDRLIFSYTRPTPTSQS